MPATLCWQLNTTPTCWLPVTGWSNWDLLVGQKAAELSPKAHQKKYRRWKPQAPHIFES